MANNVLPKVLVGDVPVEGDIALPTAGINLVKKGAVYEEVGSGGVGADLNTHINGHSVETPLKALDTYRVGQVSVTSNRTTHFPTGRASGAKTIEFSNHSSTVNVFFGPSSDVSSSTGKLLRAGSDVAIEVGPSSEFYWIAQDLGGISQEFELPFTTATGTAESPTNALISDNNYASFDFGENLTLNGLSYSKTLENINTLFLEVEARKSTSPETEMTHVASSDTRTFSSATNTFTSPSVVGQQQALYLVSILRGQENTVLSVNGAGLVFNSLRVNKTVDGKSLDVWFAYGNGTTGPITATLSSPAIGHINVLTIMDVDPTTPIQESNVTFGTGQAVTGPSLNKTALGEGILIVAHEADSAEPTGQNVERADATVGLGANTVSLHVSTKDYVITGVEALTASLSSSTGWAAIQVNLIPRAIRDITFNVEVNHGLGFVPAGSFTVNSTVDTFYAVNLSGVVPLAEASINQLVVRLTRGSNGAATGRIDRAHLTVNEGADDTSARLSFMEIMDNEFA